MNQFHFPYFVSLIIAVVAVAIIGMLCQGVLFNNLMKKEGGFLATLIASMGLMQVLSQGDLLVFGTVARSIPTVFPGVLHLGGINMPLAKVALILIGVGVTVILFLVYERTGFGRAMRTVAFLPEVASLQGINVNRIYIMTLGLATAIAGIAGGILAPTYGINPSMGNNILMDSDAYVHVGRYGQLAGSGCWRSGYRTDA